jgi:hypothetical protein
MNRKAAYFVFSILIILTYGVISGSAPDERPIMAPASQDFLLYLERTKLGLVQTFTEEGYPLGDIPLPFDLRFSGKWRTVFRGRLFPDIGLQLPCSQ